MFSRQRLRASLSANHLSTIEHVRDIIGKCAQTMHAFKILRRHGMSQEALRIVCKAVDIRGASMVGLRVCR